MSRDLGDFQTPPTLVQEVIRWLRHTDRQWTRVLEPTCGRGNFIRGILEFGMAVNEVQGIEVQAKHVEHAREIINQKCAANIVIHHASIFELDLRNDLPWQDKGPLLVIGNPPWITNSTLGTLQSSNAPTKTNFKKLNGLEALTGSSNFDIAEFIILKLIQELSSEKPTIAMLCKTLVARNILKFAFDTNLPITKAIIRKINSQEYFGAAVDACLFSFMVGNDLPNYQAEIYSDLHSAEPLSIMGISNGQLVSDLTTSEGLSFIDGMCPLTWRQGIKHDAAPIAELTYNPDGILVNKKNENVDIEHEYIYPLLKSSDLGGKAKIRPKRAVIVTQKYLGEDTTSLETSAPLLWQYLTKNKDIFEQRKSSIYLHQPPFAIFGIGNYSFSTYKVAISGMYKTLRFSAIGPLNGKPVMFDDTCYFIPCISSPQAALVVCMLNDSLCLDFLNSIIFWDAKRPVTKKVLQRIDLNVLVDKIERKVILERANLELKRLDAHYEKHDFVWPENLRDLLQSPMPNAQTIFQMSLFEIG